MAHNPNYVPELNGFAEVVEPLSLELPEDWQQRVDKKRLQQQSRILTEESKRRKIAKLAEMGYSLDGVVDILSVFIPNCTIQALREGMKQGKDEAIRKSKQ